MELNLSIQALIFSFNDEFSHLLLAFTLQFETNSSRHTHTHIPQVEFSVQEASTSSFVIHTHPPPPPPPPRPIGEQDPERDAQTLTCDLGEERWMCLDTKVETKAAKKTPNTP